MIDDLMTDEFLTRFQAPPREAFSAELFKELSLIKSQRPPRPLRWLSLGLAAVCVVSALLFISVPSVRASALKVIREIAGLKFNDDVTVNKSIVVANLVPANLAEIEREISRTVTVPTFIPEGFMLKGDAYLSKGDLWPNQWEVLMVWARGDQKSIQFSMAKIVEGPETMNGVGPAKLEKVKVNGQPAVFVRGVWVLELDPKTKKPKDQLTKTDMNQLFWSAQGLRYHLLSQDPNLPVEDLIRMAESVK